MAKSIEQDETSLLRRILDDVLTDPHFLNQTSVSAIQIAEYIWKQAALGDCDLDNLRQSTFTMLDQMLNTKRADRCSLSRGTGGQCR